MNLFFPFWLGTQSREEVQFIHLIGYGKRQKAREILTDLLELLGWQNESIVLWENWDRNSLSVIAQVHAFLETYPIFPKIVMTDFFHDFFAGVDSELCMDGQRVEVFLRERKNLGLSESGIIPSDARGSLIISFLDSFGDCDYLRTRLMFQFLWSQPESKMNMIRKSYVPDELMRLMEQDYLRREELVFFSKDEPIHILLAIELQNVTQAIEEEGAKLLGVPVKLTLNAMEYFLAYIFYKRLNNTQLHRAALEFFIPVFRQYPRVTQKVSIQPNFIQLDFKGGWKFQLNMD